MKKFLLALFCLLLSGTAVWAQRLQIGVRGGVHATDYKFVPPTIDGTRFRAASDRIGYDVGFAIRWDLARHLHLQSELNYVFSDYAMRADGLYNRLVTLHAERFEIPLQAGLQFGIVRLFGGVVFRVASASRSNCPELLTVGFNNSDVAIMGGVGLNIRKFFIDFRVQGYPRSHVWHTFHSSGVSRRVKVAHDIHYGGSMGFFF